MNMAFQRFLFLQQVHRKFFKYNGSVSEEDSGYYIALQDRRREQPLREKLDLTGLLHIENICDNLMNCGVPSFGQGWSGGRWLPRKAPVTVPGVTTLELLSKTILESNYSIRYYFKLTGPAHMTIFVNPLDGVRLVDWSFLRGVPDCPAKCKPPYQIYFSWGADSSPINFYLEFTVRIARSNIKCAMLANVFIAEDEWQIQGTCI